MQSGYQRVARTRGYCGYFTAPIQALTLYVEQMGCRSPSRAIHDKLLDRKGWSLSQTDREAPTVQKVALSLAEKVTDGLFHHCAADLGNRARQGDVLRTGFHAIVCVAAFLDAAIA